jgi:hypothetical protein
MSQPHGHTNNLPVIVPHTRPPAVPEGGSGSISEHKVSLLNSMLDSSSLGQNPLNPRDINDRNAARMEQQVAPALQQSYSSQGGASGQEWNASHRPSHVGSGNTVPHHNVQEQHHYVRGEQGDHRYFPCHRVPALMLNNTSSTSC